MTTDRILLVSGDQLAHDQLAGEQLAREGLLGGASDLQAIFEVVQRSVTSRATVLILGEAGTGKELLAHALHDQSPRHDKPFVKVSCLSLGEGLLESELFGHEAFAFADAAGPREGCFERADGGTLYLDEIGELKEPTQVKLLRVLQEHDFTRVGGTQTLRVDVRVIAAVSRDLTAEIKSGRFHEDLYSRLNVIAVTLPPLRRRKGDIPALAARFIEKHGRAQGKLLRGLSPGALDALLLHDWPGNLREFESTIERAVTICRTEKLDVDDLPISLRGHSMQASSIFIPGSSLHEIEHQAIVRTLEMVGGSRTRTAEILGISVRKIQYRLKEYGSPV